MTPHPSPENPALGVGAAIRRRREQLHLGQEALAQQLNLPLHLLEAIECEDWASIPPGRERPLTRQIMTRLDMDLEAHEEAWDRLPGGLDPETETPVRDLWERVLMGAISLGALAVLLWLVLPGPDIKRGIPGEKTVHDVRPFTPNAPQTPGAYPVLGELLPEAGVTAEGILVSLRAQDASDARIQSTSMDQTRTLRISDPWKLRVQGAFTLSLSNGAVVELEVAGKPVRITTPLGSPWTRQFAANGQAILPEGSPEEGAPTAPETDQDTDQDSEDSE